MLEKFNVFPFAWLLFSPIVVPDRTSIGEFQLIFAHVNRGFFKNVNLDFPAPSFIYLLFIFIGLL